MRISSLESYLPVDSDYAIMLESSEELYSFPPDSKDVIFCFSAEQLMAVPELPLVLVDTSPDVTVSILRDSVKANRRVEYWVPRSDTTNLRCIVVADNTEDLAIAGFRLTEEWIQLRVILRTSQDRPSDDWVAGLSAGAVPTRASLKESPADKSELTLKGLVISRLTPLAKPFKKYLPGPIVIVLYKALEKIR